MNEVWIVYTIITVVYIALLLLYFWRKNKAQEKELESFLMQAKSQMDLHETKVHDQASHKMHKMVTAMTILQRIINDLQIEAQREHDRLMADATKNVSRCCQKLGNKQMQFCRMPRGIWKIIGCSDNMKLRLIWSDW